MGDDLYQRRQELLERLAAAEARAERVEKALALLIADVADYPAWQRPCHALDVARAALTAAAAVRAPVGWKLVPVEPTDEMVTVAAVFQGGYDPINMRAVLRASIAASPPPPSAPVGWRDIESDPPPRDGTVILMWSHYEKKVLMGRADDWFASPYWLEAVTHWQNLPEPPQ